MTAQHLVDTCEHKRLWHSSSVQEGPFHCSFTGSDPWGSPVSPVEALTPVNSGDTAAVGEPTEETLTELTDRAGEYDPGDGEVGVVSESVNSSSGSAEETQLLL